MPLSQTSAQSRPDALFVDGDPLLHTAGVYNSVHLAAFHRVPAGYIAAREFPEVGGLMSYGTNIDGFVAPGRRLRRPHPQGRQARGLAGGAGKSKFELVINYHAT